MDYLSWPERIVAWIALIVIIAIVWNAGTFLYGQVESFVVSISGWFTRE